MPELTVRRLPSGLTAIMEPRPSATTVALGIWVLCGARDEPPGLAGITHLIEHLMFRGKGPRGDETRLQAIERLGGQVNGGVGRESLSLQGWVPRASFEDLRTLLFGMVREPSFESAAVALESARIAREATSGGSPAGWNPETAPGALRGHSLMNPILGKFHDKAEYSPESLRYWWETLLTPERIAVIAAGAFDPDALIADCQKVARVPGLTAEEGSGGPVLVPPSVPADSPAASRTAKGTGWVFTGPPLGSPDEFNFRLAERVFASGFAELSGAEFHSRLEFCRDRSLWTLWSETPAGGEMLRRRLSEAAEHGWPEETLEQARRGILARIQLEQDDPVWTLERLGEEWSVTRSARPRGALGLGFGSVTSKSLRDALRVVLTEAAPFGWDGP